VRERAVDPSNVTGVRRSEFAALTGAAVATGAFAADAVASSELQLPSFPDAVAAIDATIAADRADPLIAATALPRLYHHGHPTANAVVLFHGFTNVPQQFDELARRFYARGCNVYVPRIPLHGYRDRLTHVLGGLTNPQLQAATAEAYRSTRGLGTRVSAVGLSLGGTMALYLAQTQPIDLAVPVSPFLMPIGVPGWIGMPAMTVVSWLPDLYVWWDPRVKAACLPDYAYPGFPSHALAECIFFGNTIVQANAPPRAHRCTLVTNKNESAVNNTVAFHLLDGWTAGGARIDRVVLDDLGAPRHDIIDPTTFPQARTLVYPRLEAIVLGG
jgi:carboxylesterase